MVAYAKGAPEVILASCTQLAGESGEAPLGDTERAAILDAAQAMAALVTGIIALVTATFCGVGGLVGIASIVLGAKARREIDSDPARYGGRSKATAGLVTGVIALVVLGIWLMVFVLIGVSSPS